MRRWWARGERGIQESNQLELPVTEDTSFVKVRKETYPPWLPPLTNSLPFQSSSFIPLLPQTVFHSSTTPKQSLTSSVPHSPNSDLTALSPNPSEPW